MEEPRAKGVSLWLMPEGKARDELGELIDRLAARLGTGPFAPHVTLVPGLPGPEESVLDRARRLAAELGSLPVELSRVDGTSEHFRCLFFQVAPHPALRDAHERAAARFGRQPDPSFDPHLSLVYGTLAAARRDDLKRELQPLARPSFEARRLHVWRTEGPVGEWRELAALELGSGAGV